MFKKGLIIKETAFFLAAILMLSLLCSCFYSPSKENSVYYNDRVDLLILFEYSIPFIYDLNLQMKGDVEIYPIEEDDYGRTLGILQYNAEVSNPLFGENAIYCILQSGSKQESCFYEDACCIMVETGMDTEEAIEQLKKGNDWNTPVFFEKCRIIPIEHSAASGVYDNDYGNNTNIYTRNACRAAGWPADDADIDVICRDGCGLWLFGLVKNYRKADSPVCLIMMKEDRSVWQNEVTGLSVVGTHLIENRTSPWAEIHAFKQELGWTFQPPRED